VAFHNRFFRQARTAFIAGAYYPALTAACALAERILNHLILALRDDFRATAQYKTVARKDSFDNWDLAIDTLHAWDVLLPSVVEQYRHLRDVRHRALHFNPETDNNDRSLALRALGLLTDIVREQFSAIEQRPRFIPHKTSVAFVRKEFEAKPFVARVIIPNCRLVGPRHRLKGGETTPWIVEDEDYPDVEISDEEFITLFEERESG